MNENEYIKFKISKKGRLCLSLILCAICIAAVCVIIIPRYYYLQSQKAQTQQSQNQTNTDETPNQTTPDDDDTNGQNGDEPSDVIAYTTLQSSATTRVLVLLSELGGYYDMIFSKYLDTNNVIDQTKLNITQESFEQMEEYSNKIWQAYQTEFVNQGIDLSEDNISESDDMMTYSNQLNTLLSSIMK